ncbi:hypothetical protein MMC24_003546 [Lignoscripta atroalba]|nr:hypothetical protein [Lignoscripta atroalba]
MASTRLRKTFHYPADTSDEDDTPRELDEEEQEKLIAKMRRENDERNEQYMRIFLAIPLVSIISYAPALLTSRSLQAKFICLLSITSHLSTAYILLFIPNKKLPPGDRRQQPKLFAPEPGPINKYLSSLNAGLSLLIAMSAITFRGRSGVHEGFWVLCLLPGRKLKIFSSIVESKIDQPTVVLSTIITARRVMLSVDVAELEGLKYGYKGA